MEKEVSGRGRERQRDWAWRGLADPGFTTLLLSDTSTDIQMAPASGPANRLKSVESHLSYTPGAVNSTTVTTSFTSTSTSTSNSASTTPGTLTNPIISNPTTMSSPPAARPAITAHVLDTTLGRPAASIPVALLSLPSASPPQTYTTPLSTALPTVVATSVTNSDGRIAHWDSVDGNNTIISTERGKVYMLRFETEGYFKKVYGEAGGFFPWVDVVFQMGGGDIGGERDDEGDEGERKHYHVPVLLSRFGYSTYRGS